MMPTAWHDQRSLNFALSPRRVRTAVSGTVRTAMSGTISSVMSSAPSGRWSSTEVLQGLRTVEGEAGDRGHDEEDHDPDRARERVVVPLARGDRELVRVRDQDVGGARHRRRA